MISEPASAAVDPRLFFTMEAHDGAFFETATAELGDKKLDRAERIDLAIGAGVRGQTFLYWNGNQLYELPVSFWSEGSRWINSPGYKDGTANFARKTDPRCLECHATYIQPLSVDPQTNVYDKASLVAGIGCETCHGPGAAHSARPSLPGTLILNPTKFSRDRQVDQCALCHNGTDRLELQPAFSYVPGTPLDRYLAPDPGGIDEHPDVHGNQVGLLKRSACYLASPSMSCATCHNVHASERPAASYSDRCLSCHRWQSCGMSKQIGHKVADNCIDCHMPLQRTNAIVSQTAGATIRTSIRTHWIKVYASSALEVR